MCGISFILSGVQIDSSLSSFVNGLRDSGSLSSLGEKKWVLGMPYPTISDLKEVVSRRGPDHVGQEEVHLRVVTTQHNEYREGKWPIESKENVYLFDKFSHRNLGTGEHQSTFSQISRDSQIPSAHDEITRRESVCKEHINKHSACLCDTSQLRKNCIIAKFEEASGWSMEAFQENAHAELQFLGATLQLRGVHPVFQPLRDSWKNVLVYNGEIFEGIAVGEEENDAATLMGALQMCCSCSCHANGRDCGCFNQEKHISIPQLLSTIKGPWALIYWQAKSKIVWFGRDAFGRRSLLVHWPSLNDSRLLLSSAASFQTDDKRSLGRNEYGEVKYKPPYDHVHENAADSVNDIEYWDELACGIYSISLEVAEGFGCNGKDSSFIFVGKVEKHEWSNPLLKKLVEWERHLVDPESNHNFVPKFRDCQLGINAVPGKCDGLTSSARQKKAGRLDYQEFNNQEQVKCRMAMEDNEENEDLTCKDAPNEPSEDKGLKIEAIQLYEETAGSIMEIESDNDQGPDTCSVNNVFFALKQAVMRRTCHSRINQDMEGDEMREKYAPIAVLFSGGLDSMILAALLDQCLNPNCEIDLLNVSFDGPSAPDRISAKLGVKELQRIAPLRRWRLVEIDADPSMLHSETKYLTSLIHPAKTYMDLNIGIALWLASCGIGWVEEEEHLQGEEHCSFSDSFPFSARQRAFKRTKYRSEARILLVGSGADEQCAGYGRHRTKFRQGGWVALQEEMKIDVQRIWKRNLGRDDRCIADHGKEARFPFLDEDVIETLLDLPLWEIANLNEPAGQGDKKILREVARQLGLEVASTIPKRAIQFGSRIARESNRRNFGSNRAANMASAGSAVIHCFRD